MPTLQSFALNLAESTGKKEKPTQGSSSSTISARLWEASAHWPHRKYAREWGRGSGSLGNIPEVAGCVNLWRAGRFWTLKI